MLNFRVDPVSEMVAAHSNLAGSGSHEDEKVVDSLLVYFYILTESFWFNKPRMRHAYNFLLESRVCFRGSRLFGATISAPPISLPYVFCTNRFGAVWQFTYLGFGFGLVLVKSTEYWRRKVVDPVLVGCINVKVKISAVQVQPTNSLKKK